MSYKVSVIVPSYNACERLYLALEGFRYQNYPLNLFEIVVVDDGSKDGTCKMPKEQSYNFNLKVIELEKNIGRSKARNKAIIQAEGEILIFSDFDMIPDRDYIKSHVNSHKNKNCVVIGPFNQRIISYYYKDFNDYLKRRSDLLASKQKLIPLAINQCHKPEVQQFVSAEDIKTGKFKKATFTQGTSKWQRDIFKEHGNDLTSSHFSWTLFVTANVSVGRKNVLDVGLFDENFQGWGGEDWELGYRLYRLGLDFYYQPKAVSFHQEHPYSLSKRESSSRKNSEYFSRKHQEFEMLSYSLVDKLEYRPLNKGVMEYKTLKKSRRYREIAALAEKCIKNYHKNTKHYGKKYLEEKRDIRKAVNQTKKILGENSYLVQLLMIIKKRYKKN